MPVMCKPLQNVTFSEKLYTSNYIVWRSKAANSVQNTMKAGLVQDSSYEIVLHAQLDCLQSAELQLKGVYYIKYIFFALQLLCIFCMKTSPAFINIVSLFTVQAG